jgi:hypothetical protein
MGNDAIVMEKMGLFMRKVPFLEYGSPSADGSGQWEEHVSL